MELVMVGAGRLATNLAIALHEKGNRVLAVFSRTQVAAATLADRVGATATAEIDALPCHADAFILALKDDALPGVIARLARHRTDAVFLHTAGSVPMRVFLPHAQHYGVLYPMQTFSKERLVDFARVPFFIEGSDDRALQVARQIASSLSSEVRPMSSDERRYLHLAAVFACNFSNHCYALAAEILQRHGLPFSVMQSLVEETVEKVATLSPREAQTGPAVRYDEQVMNAQLQLLSELPTARRVYEVMSQSIHQLATTND